MDPTGKLGNYTVTLNNGTLTVNPAVLTFTAINTSRFYGDPNPVFVGTFSGLKNGDPISASFASTATAGSPVGTYAIVPTLLDPGQTGELYSSTVNGVLSVNPAPLNVSSAQREPAFMAIRTQLLPGALRTKER